MIGKETSKEKWNIYNRLQWLMTIRLTVITISLIIGIIVLDIPPGTFYYYIAFYYVLSVLYIVFLQTSRRFCFLGTLQIIIDLVAVTSIVIISDPISEPWPNLYILVILLSSIVFTRHGALLTTAISVFLYICSVVYILSSLPHYYGGEYRHYAYYIVYIYVTLFAATGFFANFVRNLVQEKSEQLSRLNKQTEYVFDHINTGMLLCDEEGHIAYVNSAGESILSCHIDDIVGLHWHTVLNVQKVDSVEKRKKIDAGKEVELYTHDIKGTPLSLAAMASPLNYPGGDVKYTIILFRDLSEQHKNEEQIKDAERLQAIVDMSATIAHELRNPMASISGSAELLSEMLNTEEAHKLLKIISKEVERLDSIVEDFLSFTRLRKVELTEVDINELLGDIAVLLYHNKKFPSDMKLIHRETEEPVCILADQKQLKQMLLNLGLNALESMPYGGELELAVDGDSEDNMVEITIRDTGEGISDEVREKMFTPFYTTKKKGSGIGLFVTQKVVQSHKGRIKVDTELGKGTTFRIYLPKGQQNGT